MSFCLNRLVSLVGQVALCQVTYLEGDILQELKRRRQPNKDQVLFSLALSMQQDSTVMNKIKCHFELGVHCYQAANFISTKSYEC